VNAIESWWISQRILLPLARLPWTSSTLICHPSGQLEIQYSHGLDWSKCSFRQVKQVCGVPIRQDPVEKQVTHFDVILIYIYLCWCRQPAKLLLLYKDVV
jgi:hypothetical protein